MFLFLMIRAAVADAVAVSSLSEGDLVINEVMVAPDAAAWYRGEWIELVNTTADTIDLDGLELSTDTDSTSVSGELLVAPGALVVLATRSNPAVNGGNTAVDYGYSAAALPLRDRALNLSIGYDGDTIDAVSLGAPTAGVSWALDPAMASADDNDGTDAWCAARVSYGDGDLGSPGEDNHGCAYGVDELTTGDLVITEVMILPAATSWYRGQWIELTNRSADRVDLDGLVVTGSGSDTVTVSGSTLIDAGERAILAVRDSAAVNGGLPWVDVAYSIDDLSMSAAYGELSIASSLGVLDSMSWSTDDSINSGASHQLSEGAWCAASSTYGDGDGGTPGAANDVCDSDGDGYGLHVDCDDSDAAIHPDAEDVAWDGIDQDCSGFDRCAAPAALSDEVVVSAYEAGSYCDGEVDGYSIDSLTVEFASVSDLSDFSCVCALGELRLEAMPSLESLDGMDALASVDSLVIKQAPLLEGLGDAPWLSTVWNTVELAYMDSIVDLSGLESVTRLEQLGLGETALTSLGGLDSLADVGLLYLLSNDGLADMSGLEALEAADSIVLYDNGAMVDVRGLDALASLGYLSVESNPALEDFSGLGALEAAETIIVQFNGALASFVGLGSLQSVELLLVRDNDALEKVSGLSAVEEIEVLYLSSNDALWHLNALRSLTALDELYLYDNTSLTSLDSLAVLSTITELDHLEIRQDLDNIEALENLEEVGTLALGTSVTDLYGLHNLQQADDVSLWLPDVADLSGLSSLEAVYGDLDIAGAEVLVDLTGLSSLRWVGGSLRLLDLPSLTGLHGLGGLSYAETLELDNVALSSMEGLLAEPVLDNLLFFTGPSNLDGLEYLEDVSGNVIMAGVTDLSGLQSLESVGRHLALWEMSGVSDLSALVALESVGGGLGLHMNPDLTRLDLPVLQTIGGGLHVYDNPSLVTLGDLPALWSIGGWLSDPDVYDFVSVAPEHELALHIENNDSLSDISGLAGLSYIAASVNITENDTLDNLEGLGGVVRIDGWLDLRDNASLSWSAIAEVTDTVYVNGVIYTN